MWRVVLKRCRLNALSGWFLAASGVGGAMAAGSFWVAWDSYEERRALYETSRLQQQLRTERVQAYADLELGLERPPARLSVLSQGVGERLGSSATIPGRFGDIGLARRDRPLMSLAHDLNVDPSRVLALLVGFLAVFSTHHVINGERAKGTLRQQLAKGLPRPGLLLGEYVGGVITVVTPCALLLLGLSLWAVGGGLAFEAGDWWRLVLFVGLVALYGCCWVALTLFLSVVCRQRETSLVLGVLAWVLSAALYPQAASWTAASLAPLEAAEFQERYALDEEADASRRQRLRNRRNSMAEEYRQYRRFAAVLPVTAFLDAGRLLAGTSTVDHERFLRTVDAAERSFVSWQDEKLARYPNREYRIVLGAPLDISGLPEPVYQPLSVSASLRFASLPIGALLVVATGFLSGAVLRFDRLDVR